MDEGARGSEKPEVPSPFAKTSAEFSFQHLLLSRGTVISFRVHRDLPEASKPEAQSLRQEAQRSCPPLHPLKKNAWTSRKLFPDDVYRFSARDAAH
jgi:hypothetical protein